MVKRRSCLASRLWSLPARRLSLVLIGALTAACSSPVHPVWFPVTEGHHHKLPAPGSRVVVWTDHGKPASRMATAWLQQRDLIVIEPAKLQQLLNARPVSLNSTLDDEARLLQAAKALHVDTVIFIATDIRSAFVPVERSPESEMPPPMPKEEIYGGTVDIRGVETESGELVLAARAEYPTTIYVGTTEEMRRKLTCQALATAWGFRGAGVKPISSDFMCTTTEQ
jgi:hypothetical protein